MLDLVDLDCLASSYCFIWSSVAVANLEFPELEGRGISGFFSYSSIFTIEVAVGLNEARKSRKDKSKVLKNSSSWSSSSRLTLSVFVGSKKS